MKIICHVNQSKNSESNVAETGNASNPTPHDEKVNPADHQQLLNEKAEKYLRESANIEDMPDPQEEQDAEDTMRKESNG